MCKKGCCSEEWYFPRDSLLFVHTSPLSNCFLLFLRIFFAFYLTGALIYRFYDNYTSSLDILIFMTNFGLHLTVLYYILVIQDRCFGHKYQDKYFSIYESMRNFIFALYEIAFSFEVVITIVYWGFLF